MLLDEIKEIKSTKKELKNFGLVIGSFFALLGAWFLWKHKANPTVLFGLSASFLFLGILLPMALRPIQKVWMTLALLMGWVMTRVILAVLFYLMFTPIGFIKRIFGKNSFKGGFRKDSCSYWTVREDADYVKERYENQF